MELLVSPNGDLLTLYTEVLDLSTLGSLDITRASHVEPDPDGQWFAELIGGPRLGPFPQRSDALAAEVAWLSKQYLQATAPQVSPP